MAPFMLCVEGALFAAVTSMIALLSLLLYSSSAMRRLIVGDIHAHYDMLIKVLGKASFNPAADILYSVGDLLDRGDKPVETIRFLMSLPSFRPVLGNHDAWFESYLSSGIPDPSWIVGNGGRNTLRALSSISDDEIDSIRAWYASFPVVRVEDDIMIVHGGIPTVYTDAELCAIASRPRPVPLISRSIEEDGDNIWLEDFLWDRNYLYSAMDASGWKRGDRKPERRLKPLRTKRTLFIGHTQLRPECCPFISEKFHLVAIDTGTGSGLGPLTVMDIDTRQYWQAEADGIRL